MTPLATTKQVPCGHRGLLRVVRVRPLRAAMIQWQGGASLQLGCGRQHEAQPCETDRERHRRVNQA